MDVRNLMAGGGPALLVVPFGPIGQGVLAAEPIAAGTAVRIYVGHGLSQEQWHERERAYVGAGMHGCWFSVRVSGDALISSAAVDHISRYFNHACTPNMDLRIVNYGGIATPVLYAREDILAGQQLTFEYGPAFHFKSECLCLSCRQRRENRE